MEVAAASISFQKKSAARVPHKNGILTWPPGEHYECLP